MEGGREGRGTPSRLESHGSCTHTHTELHHVLIFLLYSFSCPLGSVFLIQLALQLCVLAIRKSSQVTHVTIVIKYFLSLYNVIDPIIHTHTHSPLVLLCIVRAILLINTVYSIHILQVSIIIVTTMCVWWSVISHHYSYHRPLINFIENDVTRYCRSACTLDFTIFGRRVTTLFIIMPCVLSGEMGEELCMF